MQYWKNIWAVSILINFSKSRLSANQKTVDKSVWANTRNKWRKMIGLLSLSFFRLCGVPSPSLLRITPLYRLISLASLLTSKIVVVIRNMEMRFMVNMKYSAAWSNLTATYFSRTGSGSLKGCLSCSRPRHTALDWIRIKLITTLKYAKGIANHKICSSMFHQSVNRVLTLRTKTELKYLKANK